MLSLHSYIAVDIFDNRQSHSAVCLWLVRHRKKEHALNNVCCSEMQKSWNAEHHLLLGWDTSRNSQNTKAEKNTISVRPSVFDSVTSDTVVRKWLSCKPYCLTVALPSGSLTWQEAMALYSVQKTICTSHPTSCNTKSLLFDYKSAFPKHAHKSSFAFLLPAVFAAVQQHNAFIVSAAVCTICWGFFAIRLRFGRWSACPRAKFNWAKVFNNFSQWKKMKNKCV